MAASGNEQRRGVVTPETCRALRNVWQLLTRACRQLTEINFVSDRVNGSAVLESLCQATGGADKWDDVTHCGMINGMQ